MISQTAPVLWVAESDYGYPTVLTLHSLGMALVLGIVMMLNLRVIGIVSHIPVRSFHPFAPVAWAGLAINVVSGTLLFCANYTVFLANTAFISKIVLLCAAGLVTWLLASELAGSDDAGNSTRSRALAAMSLLLLFAALTAGRVIAYTSVPE
jgi:hypothetical protein